MIRDNTRKLVVAGSRDFSDYTYASKILDQLRSSMFSNIEIVSGCASGADSMGIKYAEDNNLKLHKFPANWDRFGKSAGYVRNREMADFSDLGICFWDGESRGTKHMIATLKEQGKMCIVVNYKKNTIYRV